MAIARKMEYKMPKAMIRPVVYDATHQEYLPIQDGQYVGINFIPVSEESGNMLVAKSGGLFVREADAPQIVSGDTGNYVRTGSDGAAFLTGNDVLSNGSVNLLTISPVDGKIELVAQTIKDNVDFVSQDAGNIIQSGSDGGAFLTINDLISKDSDNRITVAADGLLHVASPVSADESNTISEGSDGMAYFNSDLGTIV